MATAAPPAGGVLPRAGGPAGWVLGALAAVMALLLFVATISGPAAGGACETDDGADSGDVTAVGDYPEPLRFGAYTMLPSQLVFSDVVAKRVKWDVWVIRAQVLNEQNGAAAAGYDARNYFNYLNVSHNDGLSEARLAGAAVWKDPVKAGNATADWIQGKRETLGERGADSIRTAYQRGADASPMEAIRLLQNSGWASSRYPDLPGIYRSISSAGRGEPAEMVRASVVPEPVADAASCEPAADGGQSGGGVEAEGDMARRYLGDVATSPWTGFTGGPPPHRAWCSWFVTNVLRKVGIEMPVMPYSGTPYTWAAQHPKDWTLFKPLGRPATAATPPEGSLVMYKAGGGGTPTNSDHINMVDKVYPDGRFDLTGGNQGSGCPTGSCVSQHKACRLVGWKSSREPHVDCGDPRPIWGIVTPRGGKVPS